MADVEHVAVAHDLHAVASSVEIGMTDELETVRFERAGERAHNVDSAAI